MLVAHILKTKGSAVDTIAPDATVAAASRQLAARRIGAILVLGAGDRVVGILSERDIARGVAIHGAKLGDMRVAELMTRNVASCAPESTVDDIMREMTNRRVRHLPVLVEGRLVGIVSIGDVVKSRLEELAAESDMLRNYIAGG